LVLDVTRSHLLSSFAGSKHLAMTARHYLSAAIHISQQHYPEMLNKLIIINVPWLFTLIWASTLWTALLCVISFLPII
jgi:hypothetical protein